MNITYGRMALFAYLGLAGCASPPPAIMGIGPSTYAINEGRSAGSGGASIAMADSFGAANAFCVQYGRIMVLESSAQGGQGAYDEDGNTHFGMTFRCLLQDDAELKPPTLAARAGLLPSQNDNYTFGIHIEGSSDLHQAADALAIAPADPDEKAPLRKN